MFYFVQIVFGLILLVSSFAGMFLSSISFLISVSVLISYIYILYIANKAFDDGDKKKAYFLVVGLFFILMFFQILGCTQ